MAVLVFPGPKTEEEKKEEALRELEETKKVFDETVREVKSLIAYYKDNGYFTPAVDERPVAHKIEFYSEIEQGK